jgi:hypothetical protein
VSLCRVRIRGRACRAKAVLTDKRHPCGVETNGRKRLIERIARCHCGSLGAITSGQPRLSNVCPCQACQRRTGTLIHVSAHFLKTDVRFEGPSTTHFSTKKVHQPARRIVDKHQQGALRPAILKPRMLAAVDLYQFADALAPRTRLVNPFQALLASDSASNRSVNLQSAPLTWVAAVKLIRKSCSSIYRCQLSSAPPSTSVPISRRSASCSGCRGERIRKFPISTSVVYPPEAALASCLTSKPPLY